MAPEVLREERYSEKADVFGYIVQAGVAVLMQCFSFGVVLWEMVTGRIPYDGIGALRVITIVAQRGPNLPVPVEIPEEISKLLTACTHPDPDSR